MNKAVILGGNKLAFYLSNELQKNNFLTYHLSRKFQKNLDINKFIKLKDYKFENLKKKLKDISPKIVINLISYTGNDLKESIKVNSKLSNKIIKFCLDENFFLVLLGSSAEYGITEKKYITEKQKLNPISPYGFCKSLQSIYVKKLLRVKKNKILLLRIFNLSGDIDNKSTIIGKINNFITKNKKANKRKTLKLGSLSAIRDFIDITKSAKIIISLIIKKRCGVFNLGSGKPTIVRNLVKKLFKQYKNLDFIELNNRFEKNKLHYSCADLSKLNKSLNEKN